MFLFDLFFGKSSDENGRAVPDDLDDFAGWQFRNIDLHVGVSIVSGPSVKSANGSDGVHSCEV